MWKVLRKILIYFKFINPRFTYEMFEGNLGGDLDVGATIVRDENGNIIDIDVHEVSLV